MKELIEQSRTSSQIGCVCVFVFAQDGQQLHGLQAAGASDGAEDRGHVCLHPDHHRLQQSGRLRAGETAKFCSRCSNQRRRSFTATNSWPSGKQADRLLTVSVVCPSGCLPVVLLPGQEPPPHVRVVERHLQQVRLSNQQPRVPSQRGLTFQTVTQVIVGLAAPTLITRSGSGS